MKQILRTSLPAVAFVAVVGGTTLAVAGGTGHGQGMGYGMGMGGGMMMEDCPQMGQAMGMGRGGAGMMMEPGSMARLGLDDDQRERMRTMRREHMAERAERRARMLELREDMHALMAADRPDPDEIEALHARMAEHRGRMLADRVRMRNGMLDLLDGEQRERMREMHERRMGDGMGGGMGRGQRGQQ